jgi:hypothetical protein
LADLIIEIVLFLLEPELWLTLVADAADGRDDLQSWRHTGL